jgi:Zn-dependent protease
LGSFLAYPLEQIPYVLLALLVAFTVHEFAHAFVAFRFGDPTAKDQGRLTLNPSAHLDIIGTVLIFIAGFGWAKPVPVNRFYFRNPRLAGVSVSLAGPISNLIVAFVFVALGYLLSRLGFIDDLSQKNIQMISQFFRTMIYLNVMLFVFNLLPFPPLDGYRVIEDLVTTKFRAKMTQWENYGAVIFLILVMTPLGDYVFPPLFQLVIPAVMNALYSLFTT